MDLTLRQLQTLREVAARGTMAAAADALGFTTSAVSQQIGALERAVGMDVFERVGRSVRLTDTGTDLLRHADAMLAELERARVTIESVGEGVRGTVRLAVYESVASTLLTPLLDRLANDAPEVELWTRQMEPQDAYTELLLGGLDLAFDNDYPHMPQPPPAGLEREVLFHDWFRLVVPADDPLDGPVDLGDLADRIFIASGRSPCGRCVAAACREVGFEPDLRHELDDYPTSLRLVAGHAGIALVPDLGLVHPPPGVRVLDLVQPVRRDVALTHRAGVTRRPAVAAVVAAIRDVVADHHLDLVAAGAS